MKSYSLLIFLFVWFNQTKAQTPPWLSPVKICSSTNGVSFGTSTVFQDSSGVATIIRVGSSTSDTLMAAFQWFPMPMGNPKWDKIAVKFSYNGGATWTTPTTCSFTGLPANYQRPFDPALLQLPNGQIRMYFSSGVSSPPAGGIDTYSGISTDGINYNFESSARFDDASKHAIDPSVIKFGSAYYYNSWTSNQNDGAHRAISSDGLTFTTQAMFPYDNNHLWLGNYMVDGSLLKFYGCGNGMWVNSSNDGVSWNGYTNISIMGADPAVVKNKSGTYIMLYTGPSSTTDIKVNSKPDFMNIYPVVFNTDVTIEPLKKTAYNLLVIDALGRVVFEENNVRANGPKTIDLSGLKTGVYYCLFNQEGETSVKKIIRSN